MLSILNCMPAGALRLLYTQPPTIQVEELAVARQNLLQLLAELQAQGLTTGNNLLRASKGCAWDLNNNTSGHDVLQITRVAGEGPVSNLFNVRSPHSASHGAQPKASKKREASPWTSHTLWNAISSVLTHANTCVLRLTCGCTAAAATFAACLQAWALPNQRQLEAFHNWLFPSPPMPSSSVTD
eukprot:scaffold177983_cov21-Tisochrysis_lutea.AAC.2